jgi:ribosomal protein S18 acetylase RimI-like enzyme
MEAAIRNLEADDEAAWRALWSGYLGFYEAEVSEEVTAATWARLMDPEGAMFGRAVEVDGRLAGFSLSVLHPGSWTIGLQCYLEDLYVDPAVRGMGLGRALVDDLLELAAECGWARLYWHTRAGNETARKLYDRYAEADDYVRYRVTIG